MTIIGARSPHQTLEGQHDTALAALAAAGAREAFGELIRRHGSAVRGLLRRMGAAPDLADDVAQDAFLLAFEQIADFRGEGAFAGWLKRIAIRLYIRRWKRDRRLDLMAQTPEPEAADANQGDGAAAGRMDLDAALKHLSPAERACVTLCYGGGLSHVEAAEALNIPLGTLKSHIKRGLDRLKDRMSPQRELRSLLRPFKAIPKDVKPMSENGKEFRDFEAQLAKMFDAPPVFVDSDDFASSVMQRLDRNWQVRSLVIGTTGLLGGIIAVSQIMATNLLGRVESLSVGTQHYLVANLIRSVETHLVLPSLPFGGEGLWMSAGLAGLALVFALTRAIEEY